MTLRVIAINDETTCEACGRQITNTSNAVVVVDPDTDQLVVACPPEDGRNCHVVAATSRILECGLLGVVTT